MCSTAFVTRNTRYQHTKKTKSLLHPLKQQRQSIIWLMLVRRCCSVSFLTTTAGKTLGKISIKTRKHKNNGDRKSSKDPRFSLRHRYGFRKRLPRVYRMLAHWTKMTRTRYVCICEMLNNVIKKKFIAPSAPHFGGLWEAAVKSVVAFAEGFVNASSTENLISENEVRVSKQHETLSGLRIAVWRSKQSSTSDQSLKVLVSSSKADKRCDCEQEVQKLCDKLR